MTFIFRNMIIFWDISKWNRWQKKWDGGSNKIKGFRRLFLDRIAHNPKPNEREKHQYFWTWAFKVKFLRKSDNMKLSLPPFLYHQIHKPKIKLKFYTYSFPVMELLLDKEGNGPHNLKKIYIYIYICIYIMGIKELSRSIGPWVMPEDIRLTEDGRTVK